MSLIHEIFDRYGTPVLVSVFIILFIAETKLQLRKRVQSRFKRIITNFIVSIPAFALLRLLFIPLIVWLAYKNESLHFGLAYLFNLPFWTETIIVCLLLDYTNYLWHILNHKVPLLWRFHLVHHTDLDLDVTTAFRFHFGELVGSVFFRGAATFLSGATPVQVLLYEIFFEAATQFHHSNMKLPYKFEKAVNKIIVTPRMHGIHHSMIRNETDSNYSTIFSWWDRIHQTIKLNVSQSQIVTGVPAYSDQKELTIGYLLKLPFTKIREWKRSVQARNPTDENELKY